MIERRGSAGEPVLSPETELSVTTGEPAAGRVRIFCSGEIDASTAALLGEAIESARAGCWRVEVDLSQVTFLDSSGINMLVRHRSDAYELVLADVPLDIRRLFEITGLTRFFLSQD
ncbi:STAS domain-containing protein [Actinoplanes sp. TFC3]|uniref:STAS domain-containing protein n=1 Tax=Actinoplanes sp. TFC3 TaxID=1710355 RepID=UPI000AFB9E42|nr:STAS domain-containing protein [Actinoplanes sp. TFC3]